MDKINCLKVSPYIETIGSEKYRNFILQPFDINMLYSVNNNVQVNVLFQGWRGKNMGYYFKFTNEDNIVIEFRPFSYIIYSPLEVITLLSPKTINDFINDMCRYNVQLYWSDWIINNFEPKEFLNKNEIEDYFFKLLTLMEKSAEL